MPQREKNMLSPSIIAAWRSRIDPDTGKRYTLAKIGEMYGMTPQGVSWIMHNTSGTPVVTSAREDAMKHFPWTVGKEFDAASPHKRLRDHFEYQATGGAGMTRDKLKRLDSFYRFLMSENLVVEFDPSIPPSPGIKTGGWAFRPRIESDGDLIIRVNAAARVTETGRALLGMPTRLPELS